MYTQCPDCLTVFSLDARMLSQAGGQTQCGHCEQVFDALANLARQLPPEPFEHLPIHPAAATPPQLEQAVYRPPTRPVDLPEERVAPTARDDFSQLVFTPRFARGRRNVSRSRSRDPSTDKPPHRGLWIGLCLLLALILGAQIAWAQRNVLLANRTVGAWLRNTCASLGCHLPLVRDVSQLQLLARNVQPQPSDPGVLLISARFRNTAPFSQPYPVIAVSLSDARGKTIALQRLRPRDYLGDAATQHAGLAPGATTTVLVEANDPGGKAVSFNFAFE